MLIVGKQFRQLVEKSATSRFLCVFHSVAAFRLSASALVNPRYFAPEFAGYKLRCTIHSANVFQPLIRLLQVVPMEYDYFPVAAHFCHEPAVDFFFGSGTHVAAESVIAHHRTS